MNEEIDETEFYHQDFTTASEWEIFIARIEEIINQWKTDEKNQQETNTTDIWSIKSENLSFVDFDFTLSLHQRTKPTDQDPKANAFDTNHDFELYDPKNTTEHSCLATWYGLEEYAVLSASGNASINTESRIKILLSSIYVAASNLKCEIPIFVQIREKWQRCYLGVYELDTIRTNLEMVHLKSSPRLCQYLSGLLEMFRSKIVSPTTTSTISVSLQSTFVLQDFGNFVWERNCMENEADGFDRQNITTVPFGVTMDPIKSIVLKTTWNHLNHRSVRDSEAYSDFNPLEAHNWSCIIETTQEPICLLSDCLEDVLNISNNTSTIYDILGDFVAPPNSDMVNALDLLTEPKVPTISSLLSRAARNSITKNRTNRGSAPLSEDVLVYLLYFLFPDAEEGSLFSYKEFGVGNTDLDRGFKSCPPDSLPWRLAIVLPHALHSLGGLGAMAHLWYEFVQEMRYRWERNIQIPGLLPGYPDLRTNLLHQKLQMLNCCIERKTNRESTIATQSKEPTQKSSSSSDDEFFDCAQESNEETAKKRSKYSLWNQPTGRLGKFNDLTLLQTGDPLYIPITQEPVPKTEDQLEEDTDVLLKLGTDAEGSELRAKMMSASLLSDMESFKAANPGSVLEDFIRWYSPRDWIEDQEQGIGNLSARMQIEDNFWVQTWKNAKPVPAHRQKRLFDDTREAEKVLHFLDSRNLAHIVEMMMPVLSHVAIYKLDEEIRSLTPQIPDFPAKLQNLQKFAERLSRDKIPAERYESFVQEVAALELKISQVLSLMYKVNPTGAEDGESDELIANLITGKECPIKDKQQSNFGNRLARMFTEAYKTANLIAEPQDESRSLFLLPKPCQREIVLRVNVPRPAAYSAECPQFLRAVIKKDDFRLAGAFSEDTVFF